MDIPSGMRTWLLNMAIEIAGPDGPFKVNDLHMTVIYKEDTPD